MSRDHGHVLPGIDTGGSDLGIPLHSPELDTSATAAAVSTGSTGGRSPPVPAAALDLPTPITPMQPNVPKVRKASPSPLSGATATSPATNEKVAPVPATAGRSQKYPPAPPFTLPAINAAGGSYTLPMDRPVAIFFYPEALTYGCTKEACSFRDAELDGVEIVGMSRDPLPKLQKFADKEHLKYTLASDEDGKVHQAYGIGKALFGLVPERKTVFIANGVIRGEHAANISLNFASHPKFVQEEMKRLQTETKA